MDQKDILMRPKERYAICLTILIAGGLYLNSLGNQFTNWDDSMIYANPQIRGLGWKNIAELFALRDGATYQPIRVLSYAIDYHFWNLNPLGYHITNIFFYILTCILVCLTIFHLSMHLRERVSSGSHERVATWGALLFAAHPVHVEAVTWLAARKEVLQGFFFFLAFYIYLKGREREDSKRIIFLGVVLLSILFAILSKPSAVVFPAVLLVYEIARKRTGWIDVVKKHRLFFTLSVLTSLFFAFILIKAMSDAGGVKLYRGGSFFNNLLVSFYVFFYNIKLLILTINYSAAYTIRVPYPLINLQTFLVVGAFFLLAGLSVWSLKKTKVFFFSFFFFLVTLLPYLNIIPISTVLADRYLFIASFSYCFLLGIGFDKLYTVRSERYSDGFFKLLSVTLLLLLLSGYSFMTIHQNKIWENSYTLWSDAVEKYPQSNTANALMGVVYMDLGMDERAAEYLERAVKILPIDYESRNNLGIVYGRLNQPEKALKELTTAISLKPEDDNIKINLSVFYQRQREYKKSEEILKHLISKHPMGASLYFRLGLLYKDMGRCEAAISELIRATELAPHVINPYEELGNIYVSRMKDAKKGKYYYQKGIEMAPKAKRMAEDLRWMIQDLEAHS